MRLLLASSMVGMTAAVAVLLIATRTTADPQSLADRIAALVRESRGTVSLYARNLDTGRDFGVQPDRRVRTASTIKLPIACAVAAEVAAGRARWDEPLELRAEDKVPGSGVLSELSPGTTLSLRDLVRLMIVVSDNTATNLVLDRITADRVNEYLAGIGLRATRSLRKIRGDAAPLAAAGGWSRAGLEAKNKGFGIGVSTPREMVQLLDMLERGAGLGPDAAQEILRTLERQQHKDGIGRLAAPLRVASKGGALDALRSDVGVVYAPGGRLAIAITVDDMPQADYSPENAGNKLIWEISRVLIEELGSP